MKTVIIPNFSMAVSEEVFLQEEESLKDLQHVYVQANNLSVFHYAKTSGGYSFSCVGSPLGLPTKVTSLPTKLTQSFSHLPGGKIPLDLLSKILSFFMEYAVKGSDEAIAHILWNTVTSKYEVGVPTQKVSSAAANFTYDDVLPHHVIVVDIHSHNYMSSFWSGTDDKDDAKGVWLSGVFGNVGTNPSCNWRYSYLGRFIEADHDEIFDAPFNTVNLLADYPKEWNDKVTVIPVAPNRGLRWDKDWSTSREWSHGIGYPYEGHSYQYGADFGASRGNWIGWEDPDIEYEGYFGHTRNSDGVPVTQEDMYDLASDTLLELGDLVSLISNDSFCKSMSEVSSPGDLKVIDSLVTALYKLHSSIVMTRNSNFQSKVRSKIARLEIGSITPQVNDVRYKK
jgi:PRTRC genetic system protein A